MTVKDYQQLKCSKCGFVEMLQDVSDELAASGYPVRKTLKEYGKLSEQNREAHGFADNPVPERIALLHSEVSEAFEDFRNNRMKMTIRDDGKPEGFPSELADIFIRLVGFAHSQGVDLDAAVEAKMSYNKTRPFRHGGKTL